MILWLLLACNSEQVGKDKMWKERFNSYCSKLERERKQMQEYHDSYMDTYKLYKSGNFTGENDRTLRVDTAHRLCKDLYVRNKFFMETESLSTFFNEHAPPAYKESIHKDIGREPITKLLGQYCGARMVTDLITLKAFFKDYQTQSSESQTILRKSVDACKPIMDMQFQDMDWSR